MLDGASLIDNSQEWGSVIKAVLHLQNRSARGVSNGFVRCRRVLGLAVMPHSQNYLSFLLP